MVNVMKKNIGNFLRFINGRVKVLDVSYFCFYFLRVRYNVRVSLMLCKELIFVSGMFCFNFWD